MSSSPVAGAIVRFVDELMAIAREPFDDPFLAAVTSGEMSRRGIRLWAIETAFFTREFRRILGVIYAACPTDEAQRLLIENIWEEHGSGVPGRDHASLAERLARAFGATDPDFGRPLPETATLVAAVLDLARRRSFVEAVAAVGLGIEARMPGYLGTLALHLRARYDVPREDLAFLLVHVSEDADHARRALELVERHADTAALRDGAKEALRATLAAARTWALAIHDRCTADG